MATFLIQITSKNENSIKSFYKKIIKNSNLKQNMKIICKSINYRKDKNVLSVLKSPHVNKTAQEQFESRVFYLKFIATVPNSKYYIYYLKKIKSFVFLSDLKIKIDLIMKKKRNFYFTDINNFKFNLVTKKNFNKKFMDFNRNLTLKTSELKKTKNYLQLLEINGEQQISV